MPPRSVCGILLRRLGSGRGQGTGPKRGRASRGWRRAGVGWHLPSIKASRGWRLMEGGIIAAPFRLRYSPAPAWARAGVGHALHAGTSFARVETAGVGWHLPSIKASRRGRLMEGGSDAAPCRLRYSLARWRQPPPSRSLSLLGPHGPSP